MSTSSTPPSGDRQTPPQVVRPDLPPRFELDHDFTEALAHIAAIRTRRKLERDPVYREIKPQLERVLRGFEWDLEPTLGTQLTPRRPGTRSPGRASGRRSCAWWPSACAGRSTTTASSTGP